MDDAFVQAPEHRPVSPLAEATGVPVIDLSPLIAATPPSPAVLDALVAEVGAACREWGFFVAVGHGVPDATAVRAVDAGRAFFALPAVSKAAVRRTERAPLGYYDAEHTKNVKDWKEVFDIFPHELRPPAASVDGELVFMNKWPDDADLPGFREVLEEYAAAMEELAFKVLELIARSLNLRPDRLHGFFREKMTTYMRINRYPPCPRPDLALGLGRHKDSGALTILRQDDVVAGLDVRRRSGEWACVRPLPGSLVINVGDIIQVWSNDRYQSVEHRASVNQEQERFSIPYFFNPAMDTVVEPLPEMVSEERPSRYNAYGWGEFFCTRRRSNFRKLPVDNIQIDQLRKDKIGQE
ncbi:hypothetical protein HU200_022766 [Digitaria exilis]|uniref:Fe2OG dioxygenase domain-containing protein n=1 Tax=Digitaria exilis TaxID=1010633 RepID=A0A835EXD5_9POAL|nr:hypothetical protein HU200_022766 [Digitaria exilis]